MVLRIAEAELAEKGAAHVVVEVLAGVDDHGATPEPPDQRGELDDLRSGAEDNGDRPIVTRRRHAFPAAAARTAAAICSRSDTFRCW